MRKWPFQDARARFSEMLEACLEHGPQLVTRHGSDAAVLVPVEEWRRLHGAPARSLKDLLLPGGRHRAGEADAWQVRPA